MPDVSITAANVKVKGSTTTLTLVQAGEAITQGQPVYPSASDGKYYKADADASASAAAGGIAVTPAATDGYFLMASAGPMDVGGTLTVGQVYVVSTTAGGIAPYSDLASGDYVTILGVASAAGQLEIDINATGTAKA